MKAGIQTLMAEAGESACYALCIAEIAERVTGNTIEPINAFEKAFDRGYIYYNARDSYDNDNFFVKDPVSFLSMLTGKKWHISRCPANYESSPGEYVVDCWQREATGKTITHFRLADWDPLTTSLTVKNGKIASKRVFRQVG